MAQGRNDIFVEWLESKQKTNRVNVKHKIGDLGEVEKDSAVTVRFNSCRYQARVVDLSSAERSFLVLIKRQHDGC